METGHEEEEDHGEPDLVCRQSHSRELQRGDGISARKQKHGATEIASFNIDSFVKQLKLGGNI
jgi:hypothetical protein